MQPKFGGKLLLKLNIGTRPIANKYREGKMKSTLKRKLIVRETVRREAHGISNALSRFRWSVLSTDVVRIWMDRWCSSLSTGCRISRQCASTGVGIVWYASQEGGWFLISVIACDVLARIRQRSRSTCPFGLASVSSVRRDYSGLHAVRLNFVWLSVAWMHTMCLGCWRSYGFMRPVLKHGPRSLTCVRVLGWLKPTGIMKVKALLSWGEISLISVGERIIDRPILLLERFE